jgi:hypothetical protein
MAPKSFNPKEMEWRLLAQSCGDQNDIQLTKRFCAKVSALRASDSQTGFVQRLTQVLPVA